MASKETIETENEAKGATKRARRVAGEPGTSERRTGGQGGREEGWVARSGRGERLGRQGKGRSREATQHQPAMEDEGRQGGGRSRPQEAPHVAMEAPEPRGRCQDASWEGDLAGPRMLVLSVFSIKSYV